MLPISVIIITKNEVINISDCIVAAKLISDDIVVVDSGSDDGTVEAIKKTDANLIQTPWKGFGFARNTAAAAAKNVWVLAIDADERVTPSLVDGIIKIETRLDCTVYGFKRQNYFLGRKIKFGKWGRDYTYRLYNKHFISWDMSPVHESLIGERIIKKRVEGYVEHYPVRKPSENRAKTYSYARLNAKKYFMQGKKATFIKRYLSPLFDFFQSYILFVGFLDGKEGFIVSFSNAKYTFLKYKYLREMTEGGSID